MLGDEHLTQNPAMSRDQKPRHKGGIRFLATHLRLERTPPGRYPDGEGLLGLCLRLSGALPVPIRTEAQGHYNIAVRTHPREQVPLERTSF